MGVTLRVVVRLLAVLLGKYFTLNIEKIRKVGKQFVHHGETEIEISRDRRLPAMLFSKTKVTKLATFNLG